MKNKLMIVFIMFITLGLFGQDSVMVKAQRVNKVLNKIAKGRHLRRKAIVMKQVAFSQEEFNSYINKIYIPKFVPEANLFTVVFYAENRMKANVKLELKGDKYKKVPSFFKKFDLVTEGVIFSKKNQMRFEFETLKINSTSFSPELLDETFSTVQGGSKIKKSLFDWFDLLPGIKKVSVDYQKITFYY